MRITSAGFAGVVRVLFRVTVQPLSLALGESAGRAAVEEERAKKVAAEASVKRMLKGTKISKAVGYLW